MTHGSEPGDAEAVFARLMAEFDADPRVTRGTGFGSGPGRRVDGHIFAMLVRGELVVKLPRARVDALVAAGTARWFDAGKGRPLREWASVDSAATAEWESLIREAFEFVRRGR